MDQETLTAASKLRRPCYFHHAGWVSDCFLRPQTPQEKPWTEKLWIYDLRTNKHFTLKENTLKRTDLEAGASGFDHGRGADVTRQVRRPSRFGR